MHDPINYPIRGEVTPTPPNLTVERFTPGRTTPGNVGLCFSGGGSFALLSALGRYVRSSRGADRSADQADRALLRELIVDD